MFYSCQNSDKRLAGFDVPQSEDNVIFLHLLSHKKLQTIDNRVVFLL